MALREVFVGALGGTPESDGAMKASKLTMPLALLLVKRAQPSPARRLGELSAAGDIQRTGSWLIKFFPTSLEGNVRV